MKRKIASALLAIMLVLNINAFASAPENRLGILSSLNIMVGYGDGDFGLDRLVTRAEFTKMAVAASKHRNSVAARLSVSPFSDVMYDSWYAPYVYVGAVNGLLKGYKDGSFQPGGNITYEEALTVTLRLLGYEDSEFEYAWPYGQIGVAEKTGLCDNMNSYMGQEQTREQVSYLFYNLLKATPKNGEGDYVKTIEHDIYDDIILVATNNETQSVDKGYVYTSKGLIKTGDTFDLSLVGLRGDAVLKDGKIIAFLPGEQNKKTYSVFSSSGNNYILMENGEISNYKLNGDDVLYYETQKMSVDDMKSRFEPGDMLEVFLDENMKDDYVIYKKGELEGPFTVKGANWMSDKGISDDAVVIRGGNKVTPASVVKNDIVYFSPTINVVWAYSDKVTGIYESAEPNQNTPKTVTVSGKTYSIEGSDAYNALSSNGTVSYGDTVTLLLGKDGDVAGAVPGYAEEGGIVGFLVDAGTMKKTNVSGEDYSTNYISVAGMDGVLQQYETSRDYSTDRYKNCVVKVSLAGGKATLSVLKSNKRISGKCSYPDKKLGSYTLSPDSEILDVVAENDKENARCKKVFAQRLDGVNLSERDILYAEVTQDNVVKRLILNDITGDAYTYGVVKKVSNNNVVVMGEYTFFEGASKYEESTVGMTFSVYAEQPVKIRRQPGVLSALKPLEKYGQVTSLNISRAEIGNKSLKLSDEVCVYVNDTGYDFQAIPISELCANADSYDITAYYDKTEEAGGRIRVLIAKPKSK